MKTEILQWPLAKVAGLSEVPVRADWRLAAERMFHALETGDLKRLPRAVRWLLGQTTADNRIGRFGQHLLKSGKLSTNDPSLNESLHSERFTWRTPPKER